VGFDVATSQAPTAAQKVWSRERRKAERERLELGLFQQIIGSEQIGRIRPLSVQLQFAPPRRWRWDIAWPEQMVAVEIQGGTWTQGRHSRGAGYRADCEKSNAGTAMGWRVIRVTSDMVADGTALQAIECVFAADATGGGDHD
jgi:very-short-patch-repair endonuclease